MTIQEQIEALAAENAKLTVERKNAGAEKKAEIRARQLKLQEEITQLMQRVPVSENVQRVHASSPKKKKK